MASFIYVANWKMNVSLKQAVLFYQEYWQELVSLAHSTQSRIIVCPSFIVLGNYSNIIASNALGNPFLGAQDCSVYTSGAYTGDIDALSLRQVGCTFCLIGHSERRRLHHETNELVAQKVAQLQLQSITPIVCIGESTQEKDEGKTLIILEQQLKSVLAITLATDGPLYIAYEPVWAIGSGRMPSMEDLTVIFESLQKYIRTFTNKKISLLYGGSVTAENIEKLRTISLLDGVLIGSASIDFNSLRSLIRS